MDVVSSISDDAPPITPPMPDRRPSASQIRQSWPVSPRPGPGSAQGPLHAVEGGHGLARPGPADHQAVAGQAVEVVGVGGLAELEHHVVGRVHHVVDGPHAGQGQPAGQPARRRADLDAGEHPRR